jgi:predicted acetyltransferase
MTDFGPPAGGVETRAYADLVAETFAGDAGAYAQWVDDFGPRRVRVLREDGRVIAGLVRYNFGQFFGGEAVPARGLAAVVVRPELRGRGTARRLIEAELREARADGVPLMPLYPATTALYRKLGWEFACTRLLYRAAPAAFPSKGTALDVRPARPDDEPALEALYRRCSRTRSGHLDRDALIWERVRRQPPDATLHTYAAWRGDEPVACIRYHAQRPRRVLHFDLHVKDLVYADAEGLDAVLGLISGQRTVAENVYFPAGPNDPVLTRVFDSQWLAVHERMDSMLRITDVHAALKARGWPPVTAEARFQVADEQLGENAGPWRLRVENGGATVEACDGADVKFTAGGLAAWYSGRSSPAELRAVGLLTGQESGDATLAMLTAGPAPWLPDFF